MFFLCAFIMKAQNNQNRRSKTQSVTVHLSNMSYLNGQSIPNNGTIELESGSSTTLEVFVSATTPGWDGQLKVLTKKTASSTPIVQGTPFNVLSSMGTNPGAWFTFTLNASDFNATNGILYAQFNNSSNAQWVSQDYYQIVVNETSPECNLPSPSLLSESNIQDSSATLSWNNVSNNEGYELKYRKGNGNYTTVNINQNVTYYNLSNLSYNSSYNWKVATRCNGVTGNFSGSSNFSTLDQCTLSPPSVNIPINSITDDSAQIDWDPLYQSVSYQLEYKISSASQWTTINNIVNTNILIDNLSPDTNYEVRVRGRCANGLFSIAWSPIKTFNTAPTCNINPPTTITLTNNNNLPPSLAEGLDVTWSPYDNNTEYEFQYRSENSNSWLHGGYDFTTLVNLSASTTYFIRVRTRCLDGGYGPWGENSISVTARTSQVNIYPNPAKDRIKFKSIDNIKNLEIVNQFGRRLLEYKDIKFNTSKEININSLPVGLYFIKIELENGEIKTKRLIKQ
ncbi:fibronectin type III domain-containing protein [Olleya sp. YS]|uniref:T9SS type A sorting domain-containing protein n=1 Tax=Olleya sp. YS TaxID=3028318 RepID=UPI00243462D0|nr:fibronectin type III domain-containing protein [Olleya sp. YS]WGD35371.1 fibronectin type III domain-containing protein [Olleya sp. YS]